MATTSITFNGQGISIKSRYVGTAKPWDNYIKQHHKITVNSGESTAVFDYYCNTDKLDSKELVNAFYCFLTDGISYKNAEDILDFKDEFGYTNSKECRRVYEACKESYETWQSFGIDIFDLSNWLQENYNL
mgnify:CR=1 FL=1